MKLAAVIFLLIPGIAFCEQVQSASKPSQVVQPTPTAAGAPVLRRTLGTLDTLSIDCTDADIRTILLDVAKSFGIKVVLPDALAGSATIHLRDVTWRQIFQVVLAPIGYTFIERDDEVDVMTVEHFKTLPPDRRRVKLAFQRPPDLAIYLKKVFKGRITVEGTADGVIITTRPGSMKGILQDIARVDRPEVSLERFVHPRKLYFPDSIPKNLPLPESLPSLLTQDPNQDPGLVTTDVIILNWVESEPVTEVIERECPALVKVSDDLRANVLIITGTYAQLRKVTALVAYLDDKKWYEPPKKQAKTAELPAVTAPAAKESRQQ